MADKQLASESRAARFACPEGGEAVISFPAPLTGETIDMLETLCVLLFRGLRRHAEVRSRRELADAEYTSWSMTAQVGGNAE